jgi:hypothetical protein
VSSKYFQLPIGPTRQFRRSFEKNVRKAHADRDDACHQRCGVQNVHDNFSSGVAAKGQKLMPEIL